MSNLVKRARDLAFRAHAGQVDKSGNPYIEHVARVAETVSDDPVAEAVAWLHDVVEDCPDFEDHVWRFPSRVCVAVSELTRVRGESLADYYAAIRRNPISLRVKLADIADNADESRLTLLDEKTANRLRRKYARAIEVLTRNEAV